MTDADQQAGWITSPGMAAGAVGVALWSLGIHVRTLVTHRSPQWHGFHEFDEILPHYTAFALEVVPYFLIVWILVTTLREHRGAERAWWTLLCCTGLLQTFRLLQVEVARVVLYAQVVLEVAMVLSAILLFFAIVRRRGPDSPSNESDGR